MADTDSNTHREPDPPNASPISPTPSPEGVVGVGLGKALMIGVVSALIAWGAGELAERKLVAPSVSEFEVSGNAQFAMRGALMTNKATISLACLGGALSLGLAVAGGVARSAGKGHLLLSALAGLILGAAAGGASARALVPWFVKNERPLADDLVLPMLTHGGMAAAIGLAAGLSLAIGLAGPPSRFVRSAIAGLAGGAVSALLYEPTAAFLFPLDQTGQPLAAGPWSRLMALAVPAVSIALLAVFSTREPRPRSQRSALRLAFRRLP